MIKKLSVITTLIISLTLAGCASIDVNVNTKDSDKKETEAVEEAVETPEKENSEQMANPWREITAEEAAKNPRMFIPPEGATNVVWRILDSAADENGAGPLIELDFDEVDEYHTQSFTARYQYGVDQNKDISGMYYDWAATDEGTLAHWGEGNMPGKFSRYVSDEEMADLATWYDIEVGISYSLSTVAPDLDGFDIQAVVEQMYPGDDVIYADIP